MGRLDPQPAKTFPGLMSFPVITVIEEVETPEEYV